MKKNLVKSLVVYMLAAGAAAVASNATISQAALIRFNNGGAGWYDATSNWNQDMLSFKMNGTVVLNSGDTGLQSLGQDADTFTFAEENFFWNGTDELDAVALHVGANVGYVASSDVWKVARLGAGYEVGPALADGRQWADSMSTDNGTAGMSSWNYYWHPEWAFAGSGYIGLYTDDVDGRHYELGQHRHNGLLRRSFG